MAEYSVQDVHSTRGYFAFADEKGSTTTKKSNSTYKSRTKQRMIQKDFETLSP